MFFLLFFSLEEEPRRAETGCRINQKQERLESFFLQRQLCKKAAPANRVQETISGEEDENEKEKKSAGNGVFLAEDVFIRRLHVLKRWKKLPPTPHPPPPSRHRHLCLCTAPRSRECRFVMRTTLREPQRDTGGGWGGGVKVQLRLLAYNPRRRSGGVGVAGSRDIKSMMRLLVEV